MKNNHRIKLIAASLALTTSLSAMGGLGGLNVQSNLGEPFSGTVTVTGEEAKVLLNGGSPSLSDGNLRTSVRKSGDKAVISIRSNAPINDPVLVFQVGVGSQSRQYTAIIDPADYAPGSHSAPQSESTTAAAEPPAPQAAAHAKADTSGKKRAHDSVQAKKEKKKPAEHPKIEKVEKNQYFVVPTPKPQPLPSGNYKVRHGENLTFIAEKVRPQGLTLAETIHALVAANPKIFPDNNPDIVIAGSTLNIPSASELKQLSKQSLGTAKTKERAVVETPDTAEKTEPASQPSLTAGTETQAASAVATPAASEPVATPAEETASSVPASVAEEEASATEKGQEAAQPEAAATATPAAEQESSGWWRWLLFAGLGAIAAWLLLRLLGKKQDGVEAVGHDADEHDSIVLTETAEASHLHQDFDDSSIADTQTYEADPSENAPSLSEATVAGAAAASTVAAAQSDEGLDVEDDFDDEIFFSETETIPADKAENDFSLDLGSIDRAQNGIVSGALTQDEETQKRENADWDNIESTESVYEPEPESQYQHVAVEFTPAESTTAAETADIEPTEVVGFSAHENVSDHNESDVDTADIELESFSQVHIAEVEETEIQASEDTNVSAFHESEHAAGDAIDFEPLEFTHADTSTASVAMPSENDASALEEPFEEQQGTTITEKDSDADASAIEFDIEPVAVEESTVPAFETEVHADVAQEASDSEWKQAESESGLSFQDEEPDTLLNVNVAPDDNETIEWESLEIENDGERGEIGFISESVGMTAPLEAKYELAQMYVEIGDPNAAKETLQELLEEADGAILEKAKAMLSELNQ